MSTVNPHVAPAMSVVLVAASGGASIARTMHHLRAQTVASILEIVIVGRSNDDLSGLDFGRSDFAAMKVLEVGPITQRGDAAAKGIAITTAPIVGLIEDHSFPEPQWAEHLIGAHKNPAAGVGPGVDNANPSSALSCANFILSYGAFSGSQTAGERDLIPWHNSSYKRDALLRYSGQLGDMLEWEGRLQDAMMRDGYSLWLEPAARTRHLNVSLLIPSLGQNLQAGRTIGAMRADREGWGALHRILRACAFPLYPVMQLRRMSSHPSAHSESSPMTLKVHLTLVAMLFAMAAGEAIGIVMGLGNAAGQLEEYDLHRLRYISGRERNEVLEFMKRVSSPATAKQE